NGSDQDWVAGLTAGVGLEGYISERWTARFEYLFVDVPETTLATGGGNIRGGSSNHVGRDGLSYQF
ncbi:MAG: outer membrane protein, partial [Cohaesibacteraceae bacterium]